MSTSEPCELLEWDTAFFGRRIARVRAAPRDAAGFERALAWCRNQAVDCLYLLIDTQDSASAQLAERFGCRLVDVRVTLERELGRRGGQADPHAGVRPARAEDLAALRVIARASHRSTRFYHDEHFPPERCDALYEAWIEGSLAGRLADAVLVAERDGLACGYVTCRAAGPAQGQIGLLALAEQARGRGLGSGLVRAALGWFEGRGHARAAVVAQGRNVAALRLYERAGFLTAKSELWFHRWCAAAAEPR